MKRSYSFFFFLLLLGFLSCDADKSSSVAPVADTGVAGSYARFIIVDNFMYIVDDASIQTFSLTDESNPQLIDQQEIGERI